MMMDDEEWEIDMGVTNKKKELKSPIIFGRAVLEPIWHTRSQIRGVILSAYCAPHDNQQITCVVWEIAPS